MEVPFHNIIRLFTMLRLFSSHTSPATLPMMTWMIANASFLMTAKQQMLLGIFYASLLVRSGHIRECRALRMHT
jgi:hypothetical protein